MGIPGDGGNAPGKRPMGERQIRRRLRHRKAAVRLEGLAEFDRMFRFEIGDWLVAIYRRRGLQSTDLPIIWDKVGDAVHRMANGGRIRAKGDLRKLARKIARRKALDYMKSSFWRRRDRNRDVSDLMDRRCGMTEFNDLLEEIRLGINQLSDADRAVLGVRLNMFLRNGYPPTTAELAIEYKEVTGVYASYNFIKGHLQRGRQSLRPYLANRGILT